MANMSYCRFRNTRADLDDCLDFLEYGEEDVENLSKEEFTACKRMFNRFIDFCMDNGIIKYDGGITDRLEEYFNAFNVE